MINSEKKFDVIVPIVNKDLDMALKNIPYILGNIKSNRIIFIGAKEVEKMLPTSSRLDFIDEDEILPELKLSKIQMIMNDRIGSDKRSGWYFQQFLKMAYAYLCDNNYYVVWDADTIPLNKINFWDLENEKYLFTMKNEFNEPYFSTLRQLFNGKVTKYNKQSFIAEHMIFDKRIMLEMIQMIEDNSNIDGDMYFEKILYSVDINDLQKSGFSEFETYGNYVMKYHEQQYGMRKLRTLREGIKYLGASPNNEQLIWASKDYDIISIEKSDKISKFSTICNTPIAYKYYSLGSVVRIRNLIRKVYRKILRKPETSFD
jgi:hypothetical protein